jgi:hypothetical protein
METIEEDIKNQGRSLFNDVPDDNIESDDSDIPDFLRRKNSWTASSAGDPPEVKEFREINQGGDQCFPGTSRVASRQEEQRRSVEERGRKEAADREIAVEKVQKQGQ